MSLAHYLAGGLTGFFLTLWLLSGQGAGEAVTWIGVNLGYSVWLFTACFLAFLGTLIQLGHQLSDPTASKAGYEQVAQLDQLSDVLIHAFVGIGVIWTAVGMRNALVSTLSVPEGLANDASHVLARLVDGGILLALSTTIAGAVGGYLMRLFKTVSIGIELTAFYQHQNNAPLETALHRLGNIERLLESVEANAKDQTLAGHAS